MTEPHVATGARISAIEGDGRVICDIWVCCPLCGADDYRVRFRSSLRGEVDPQRHYTSTSREFGRWTSSIVECRSCSLVRCASRISCLESRRTIVRPTAR